jgi:hypothetical protein
MPGTNKEAELKRPVLTAGDVIHLAGPVTDDTLLAVLKCEPTMEELEVAASYLRGEGSKVSRSGHPMTGKVAQLYDILSADALYTDEEA